MKKIVALLVALLMVASLCLFITACSSKPDINQLVTNANMIVDANKALNDDSYKFEAEFIEEEMTYVIIMSADEKKVAAEWENEDEDRAELLTKVMLKFLDENTDAIALNLSFLVPSIELIFEDTEVSVIAGYVDRNGEVTRYH